MYLKIPVTLSFQRGEGALARVSVEESIRQFIEMLITTKQGECTFNPDFGYEIWSREFEPILNFMKWQPVFMEQIKYLLEKYENRISGVQVREPVISKLSKSKKTTRDYRITLTVDYVVKQTGERFDNIKIAFDY